MRIYLPTASTRSYYERNAVDKSINFQSPALAPHGVTTRANYTVPANRKALISNLYSRALRDTVAAPVGIVRVWFVKNIAGAAIYTIDSMSISNVLGLLWEHNVPMQYFLKAGDTVEFQTMDASTGGGVFYSVCAVITEFDA